MINIHRPLFCAVLYCATATADPALDGYAQRVASYGAAEAVDEDPCGPGEILWHRDLMTDLCAPLCSSDAECVEGIERCAALPLPGSSLQQRAFVDDEPELLEHIEAAADRVRERTSGIRGHGHEGSEGVVYDVIAVCDPFFEFEGSLSADLVAVVELSADE